MLVSAAPIGTAEAAGPVACRHYARVAVQQWRLTQIIPACQVNASRRWHGSFDRHLAWCRKANYVEIGTDVDQRQAHITRCRARLRRA